MQRNRAAVAIQIVSRALGYKLPGGKAALCSRTLSKTHCCTLSVFQACIYVCVAVYCARVCVPVCAFDLTWLCAVGSLVSKPTRRDGSPVSSSHCQFMRLANTFSLGTPRYLAMGRVSSLGEGGVCGEVGEEGCVGFFLAIMTFKHASKHQAANNEHSRGRRTRACMSGEAVDW